MPEEENNNTRTTAGGLIIVLDWMKLKLLGKGTKIQFTSPLTPLRLPR